MWSCWGDWVREEVRERPEEPVMLRGPPRKGAGGWLSSLRVRRPVATVRVCVRVVVGGVIVEMVARSGCVEVRRLPRESSDRGSVFIAAVCGD